MVPTSQNPDCATMVLMGWQSPASMVFNADGTAMTTQGLTRRCGAVDGMARLEGGEAWHWVAQLGHGLAWC